VRGCKKSQRKAQGRELGSSTRWERRETGTNPLEEKNVEDAVFRPLQLRISRRGDLAEKLRAEPFVPAAADQGKLSS